MPELFYRIATRSPQAVAGWRADLPVTHGELLARVRAWTALGLRTPATRVALYFDDSLEFAASLVGAWLSGKTVWLGADVLPATCAALEGQVEGFWGAFPQGCAPLSPLAGDDWQGEWRVPAADFPALVVFTSGSTGAPVPIPKQLSQLSSEIAALETQFGARIGEAAVLATVSHQHIYGLLFRILWPLAEGRAIHAGRHEFPETLAPALALAPCVLLGSPAHLKRLPAHLDWARGAGKLKAVFSSGGMLEEEAALHTAALLGQAPVEVYGSSETGGVAWRQRGAIDSWQPLPGVAWRADADGLLEVQSAFAGPGGWQRLADRVEAGPDDSFVLRGRADRIVKIEEKRISLDAIEAALCASPLVREARVAAVPAPGRQVLAAFVVLAKGGQALLDGEGRAALNARLRQELAAGLEAVALPRRWRYLERLPVNAQGKTTQALLLSLLDERPRYPALRVLEQAPQRVLLELTVPADLLYFDGHFSVAPVLPGVVQVDWAIHYARKYLALSGSFGGINALKFQQMIRPDQPVQLELVHDMAKGQLHFRYFSDAGAHASGRILMNPDLYVE